ncbi:glutamine synthetase/guanido kinase [Penicillium frequentans]|nr:glutamine synthetase/guanido kinase [Penicillium glabrum]
MLKPKINASAVTTSTPLDPIRALERLRRVNPDITFVRFQWQDYSGVLRAKVLVIEACLAMIAGGKFLHAPPMALDCAVNSTVVPGTDPIGVYWLIPDWSTLQLHTSPGTAIVMCGVVKTTPSSPIPNGELCPRQALVKVVREAAQQWQLDILVGFEVEFQVMKLSDGDEKGAVRHSCGQGHFAASSLLYPCWSYVEDCVRKLRTLDVHVEGLHPEGKSGQYEITLGPLPPLQAVDQLVLVHNVLKHTFSRHGYMVTMSPKPVPAVSRETNGQHMHLSIHPASPDKEEYFLAGILKRLPSLWAFFLPQDVSYERVGPFMAGDYVGWGTENRKVPIRKIEPGHWEIRSIDATANMYLTLAAVLSAGLLGLAGSEPLIWPDMSTGDWPNLSQEEIYTHVQLLPRSLDHALSALNDDFGDLDKMLGKPMMQHYVKLKRHELLQIQKMGPEKARDLLVEIF